jgi:PKD repeat protein
MKILPSALLGSIAILGPVPGLQGVAAAQTAVTRIAYDQCWADGAAWDSFCYIGIVVDGHDTIVGNGVGPKWSPDGSRIAFTGTSDPSIPYYMNYSGPAEILVLNLADGSIANLTNHPANDWGPVWSRDGGKIAFVSDRDGWPELYVMDANGANATRMTHSVGFTGAFGWSADGSRFAFASDRDGAPELYAIDAAGSNLTRLTNNAGFTGSFVWSPDGSRIAFDCVGTEGADICAINGDGTNLVRLTSDPAKDSGAVFSPVDGRIAFVTERFGTGPEIAVMDADGAVTRIAAGIGGGQPVWAPDGNRLIFVSTIPSFYTGTCYFGGGAHPADDFCIPVYGMYLVNADGTGLTALASGANPDWFRSLPGQPVGAFTYDCSGATCDFDATGSFDPDGTIAGYLWQFGDGTSSSAPTVHHAYATGNQYPVSLTVTDNSGATGVVMVRVRANTAPVALFTVACSGPTCTFDGSGSSDPDGTIASYSWSFGDGQSGAGATVNHTYATGTFSARLTVTDNGGATGTALGTLSVVNAAPVAAFTSSCNGLTCTFDGSGSSDSDGTITQYHWSFADGSRTVAEALGATASYTFAAGGTYTVTLIVTDNGGTTGTVLASLSVVGATFTSTCNGLTCTFDGSGSSVPGGTITQYQWSFGDGSTALGVTASHTFAAGTYTVTLIVTGNGGTTTQSQTVSVVALNVPPIALFTFTCSGLTCSFDASGSSDSDGTISGYEWCFMLANGWSCRSEVGISGATANYTFAAGGSYTVTLAVVDNAGALSRTSHVVTLNAPPVASFTSACSGLTCNFNASGSSDPDGTIASYAWTFGDGTTGAGATTSRAYAAGGSYSVTLTVTDNAAATSMQAQSVTVVPPDMHVGDLDGASTAQQNAWTATVTVAIHNSSHGLLANSVASGTWNDGSTGSCTTNATGRCAVSKAGIPKKTGSVNFAVTNVALGTFVYKAADNHDPDGDSNGTTITVIKP